MKRRYMKPEIVVEILQMDSPIATNCLADKEDMNALMAMGYFDDVHNCSTKEDAIQWGGGEDTICYHSNVLSAFTS